MEDVPHYCGQLYALLECVLQRQKDFRIPSYSLVLRSPRIHLSLAIQRAMHCIPRLPQEEKVAVDQKLMEIVSHLPPEIPAIFDIKEQSQFALGYYHNKQKQGKKHE